MKRKGPLALCLFAALLLMPSSTNLHAQDESQDRSISVSGEGRVRVAPDMATVRFGIVTEAVDPEEARAANALASRDALNAVRGLGVPENKIKLESLRLQPAREYDPENRRYREVGFEISRRLVVELTDLDQLPALITEVVQKGANRLEGIAYDLEDRESARNDALREAVRNAREKADLMADALGVAVGEVMRVNERGIQVPGPLRMELTSSSVDVMKTAAAPEPEAYAAGELEISATVLVAFRLASKDD